MVHDASSSVLLTYKGKILLSCPDLPTTSAPQYSWSLIGGNKIGLESPAETVKRKIKYTTKLDLDNLLSFSSSRGSSQKNFFHGELTDGNVNSIERREGQRLEFFAYVELGNLTLTEATEGFLSEHRNTVKELLTR